MRTIGYVRVSTDKQAEQGVSLEAQTEKIRAMSVVHGAELLDIIVDGGESAKSLHRPGMTRLLAMVDTRQVQAVIVPSSTGSLVASKICANCWSASRGAGWP
jgi:site-specific DNA recombinase